MSPPRKQQELDAIAQRYARRAETVAHDRYSLLRPEVWQMLQERQRALLRELARRPGRPEQWRLTEVGCGAGGNLLEMLRLGLAPEHLTGIELLPERHALARAVLPAPVQLSLGDASQAGVGEASQDLVLQSTVFSSILDDGVQQALAQAMWRWLRPGGAVLWYDFIVDNPRNRDVRGVPLARVRALFPEGRLRWQRLTLAPPLARLVCRAHPAAYTVFNSIPWLRTHVLAVIEKP
ncbi:class I SAM-dependent methyltransferase [Kinneretia asaccharophila]|uniref:Methyltransferase family protein n=1 Tax=Roseateles asaccharophilus TaxID=582607 RepID=A0A4R6MZ24_9BURK|nr:class I SAM-dependent methyltransferase [Roseateles asaccharophilus]MDN3545739.1 class I SAM-dependent methyltransferase [Roseateles asaccharophilus]TDP07607.1 methyltransferase family protein [Roseateles asaccharophilus]